MATKVSPVDAYNYLSFAKSKGWIRDFEKIQADSRVYWTVFVPSTHYDHHHEIEWTTIVLTSREVCAFIEGCWAAAGIHPVHRAGAYRAGWEANHVMPHPFR